MLSIGINFWNDKKDADKLSLDLQFATDKTLTARKGPTPTFTRSTIATYFGPNTIKAEWTYQDNDIIGNTSQTTLLNGRYRWEDGDIGFSYTGTAWLLSRAGTAVATSAPTSNAWRPDQADWSSFSGDVTTLDTFGIVNAAIDEPRFEYDPVTFECLGLIAEETSTNYVFPSTTLGTQTRTTTAVAHTLSFYGTGTVTLSGTHAATVVGTSSTVRRTYTFTPTAGSLTLTVTGTVSFAQLERQSVASSYIRTTTAIGTRAIDNFNYDSISDFYNEVAGTIVCESTLKRVSLSGTPNTAIFGNSQNGINMRDTTTLTGAISNDEDAYFSSVMGSVPLGVFRKSAMAFENAGSAILCQNGTLGTQDDSISLPLSANNGVTPTQLNLFSGQNSIIKSFRYYKKRLPNTKLQSLTSLVYNANDYVAALTAAGATVTAPQRTAISTFISGEIAAGRWDSIKRLYLPIWGGAAANAICMKSLTSSTFVGGVTHGAGYVQGDEITGYANTNTTPSSIGLTKDSYYAGCLCIQRGGYDHIDFGLTGFTGGAPLGNFYCFNDFFFNESTEEHYFNSNLMSISEQNVFHSSPMSTLYSVSGTTSSRFIKDRNSSGVTTRGTSVTTNTRELNDISLYLMNANQGNAPTSFGWSSSKYGAFFFGTALSDSQDTAYTLALKTLWETCTGLTLPTL